VNAQARYRKSARVINDIAQLQIDSLQDSRRRAEAELIRTRVRLAAVDPSAPTDPYDGLAWTNYLAEWGLRARRLVG
jgi:hypothetical protein